MKNFASIFRNWPTTKRLATALITPFIVSTTSAQVAIQNQQSNTIQFQTQPYVFYELQQAAGTAPNQTWSTIGKWKVGDGSMQQWVVQSSNAATADYQVVATPINDLNPALTTFVQAHGVPAISALVLKDGKVHAIGAMGTRRVGVEAPVTVFDKWHNGSVTKGMTATLAGILVEQGLITWQTTLGEVFPDKVAAMADGWSGVTLKQLLSNTSGAPGALNSEIWSALWSYEGLPKNARLYLIDILTPTPLAYSPGAGYEYSNAGFSIAGAMLEAVTGSDWETLMKEKLFGPLGMEGAGFGVTATPRMLDQPYGHGGTIGNFTVYEPGRNADNPPAIGPSATAHTTLIDMARYLELHLRGERNETGLLLQPTTFDNLHTFVNPATRYALGWIQNTNGWLSHTGSNTYNFTNVWIAPQQNWACVVNLNYGGPNAFEISDAIVVHLINNFM